MLIIMVILLAIWMFWREERAAYAAVGMLEKQFPDVSFWQGDINWLNMRQMTDVIILRAGQNLWQDSKFEMNYLNARRLGMKRGIYWFYDDRVSPKAQFDVLKPLIEGDLPELPVFIDWESSYGGAYGSLKHVVSWMKMVEAAFPTVEVGFYTGYYWFLSHTSATLNAAEFEYLRNKPLWEAWYTTNFSYVKIPPPWDQITFWQFGTPAVDWGQESREIDMNYFVGSEVEFYRRFGGVAAMAKNKVTVTWDGGARERSQPHASGTYRDILPDNSVHYSDFDPVPDMDDPGNPDKRWIKLQSGWYIATRYPSSSGIIERAIVQPMQAALPDVLYIGTQADGSDLQKYGKVA